MGRLGLIPWNIRTAYRRRFLRLAVSGETSISRKRLISRKTEKLKVAASLPVTKLETPLRISFKANFGHSKLGAHICEPLSGGGGGGGRGRVEVWSMFPYSQQNCSCVPGAHVPLGLGLRDEIIPTLLRRTFQCKTSV